MTANPAHAQRPSPLAILVVSAYLLVAAAWLLLTRRIPSPGFARIVRNTFRGDYAGPLGDMTPEQGCCWTAAVPGHLLSDLESASRLAVFENDRQLGPGHASHAEIRALGAGRYSHWGAVLYFSTSDNTDPRTNGRHYTVREVRP